MKRDLQLLRMRNVLDAKRHYKKDSRKPEVPPFSQVGTIQEGPTEFFSSRINNRDRKQTLANQVMAIEHSTGRFKSKYLDRQVKKKSGKKAHVKAVKAKRSRNPFV